MKETLTITDNRTGKTYELHIEENSAINAIDLRKIKIDSDDFGLLSYDPSLLNTATCKSSITFIDGERGILKYRGYPIEQLAEKSSFLEVCYLLIYGELPTKTQFYEFERIILSHTYVHEHIKKFMNGFNYDAHPMGILVATISALSCFWTESKNVKDQKQNEISVHRLIAKSPTLAAFAYRHRIGMPYVYPRNDYGYVKNFLHMMFSMPGEECNIHPVLIKALDTLFILHADHEQNCSTNAMRSVGSSHCDPFTAVAAAVAALYGPLHGGANEAVLKMLAQIGSKDKVPEFIRKVKAKEAMLMGFGHRVYKSYDPRASIVKKLACEVFEVTGMNPLLELALEVERIALEDEYFVNRGLYPNVDFYTGLIYQSMKFPVDIFTVLFAIGRIPGWCSQWLEMFGDPTQKIVRPRQLYTGHKHRDYVSIEKR
jgi:citrate synthase